MKFTTQILSDVIWLLYLIKHQLNVINNQTSEEMDDPRTLKYKILLTKT